jgi:hypothetical protein
LIGKQLFLFEAFHVDGPLNGLPLPAEPQDASCPTSDGHEPYVDGLSMRLVYLNLARGGPVALL